MRKFGIEHDDSNVGSTLEQAPPRLTTSAAQVKSLPHGARMNVVSIQIDDDKHELREPHPSHKYRQPCCFGKASNNPWLSKSGAPALFGVHMWWVETGLLAPTSSEESVRHQIFPKVNACTSYTTQDYKYESTPFCSRSFPLQACFWNTFLYLTPTWKTLQCV